MGGDIPGNALSFQVGDRYRTIRHGDPVALRPFASTLNDAKDFGAKTLRQGEDVLYRATKMSEFFAFETWSQANGVLALFTGTYADFSKTYEFTYSTMQLNIMASELLGTPYRAVGFPLLMIDAGANYLERLGEFNQWSNYFFHERALDSLGDALDGSRP